MKQFNLEEYLANPNRKVVTRDGRAVEILCTNYIGAYPIVAQVEGYVYSTSFCKDGRSVIGEETPNDLFFAPEKKEGWVNIYKNAIGHIYTGSVLGSKEEAEECLSRKDYLATAKIQWEE